MTHTVTSGTARARRRTRPILILLVSLVVATYAGANVWLVTQETEIVFRAGRPLGSARPAAPMEQIDIPRPDGLRQFAWIMRARADADHASWALFLHGNAATIASRANIARYEQLRSLGLNVIAAEYRGFGGLDGVPTEAGLYGDARAAYEHLRQKLGVPAERIAIYGWSLGGAVAVDLASQVPQGAVILEGAPASLVTIGQAQYPLFPIRLLMRNPFDAIFKVDRIKAPILFLHSPEDRVIPVGEGRRLFDAATAPKRFVEVRGGHINAAEVDANAFLSALGSWLEKAGVIRATPVQN